MQEVPWAPLEVAFVAAKGAVFGVRHQGMAQVSTVEADLMPSTRQNLGEDQSEGLLKALMKALGLQVSDGHPAGGSHTTGPKIAGKPPDTRFHMASGAQAVT